jgi:hypothetical protein
MKSLNLQQQAAIEAAVGKGVRVTVVTLRARGKTPRPGLRFDKVVQRLLTDLRAVCAAALPGGMTALVTVTAPIRLPGKTIAALEEKLRARPSREAKMKVHGNLVRLRIVKHKLKAAPKFMGFVHNPDTDPVLLMDRAEEFLAAAKTRVLVVAGGEPSGIIAYRAICEQLGVKQALLVSVRGKISAIVP